MDVHEPEHSVLIHGTKLRPISRWIGQRGEKVLDSVKHMTINELNELVETIARVNSKSCCS